MFIKLSEIASIYSGILKIRSKNDGGHGYKIIKGTDLENFYDLNLLQLESYYSKHLIKKENEIQKNDILMKVLPPYKFWVVDKNYSKVIVDNNILIIRCLNYNQINLWLELQKKSKKLLESSNSIYVKYAKKKNVLELNIKDFSEKETLSNIKLFNVLGKIDQLNKNLEREVQLNTEMFNWIIKGENNGK